MTRLRSDPDDTPSEMMVEYYRQRASEGSLMITESSHVMKSGRGYAGGPGIYEDHHIEGWKKIADAVHAKGARIFMQLVHDGRQSHVDLTGGTPPIAPSEVPFEGLALTQDGWVPVSMHRAVGIEEIPELVEAFRKGAERALAAGFDGVELHSANGYLVDTFLQDGTNKRTDAYGGPVENRARFLLELTQAVVSVWGGDRTGVRVSPSGQWGEISDSNPEVTFSYVAEQLNRFGLAYLHVIEPRVKGVETLHEGQAPVASVFLRKIFKGPIIAAGGFDRDGGEEILQKDPRRCGSTPARLAERVSPSCFAVIVKLPAFTTATNMAISLIFPSAKAKPQEKLIARSLTGLLRAIVFRFVRRRMDWRRRREYRF